MMHATGSVLPSLEGLSPYYANEKIDSGQFVLIEPVAETRGRDPEALPHISGRASRAPR